MKLDVISEAIVFTAWASDGTIIVNIDGRRYKYIVDAAYHPALKRQARVAPGKALNHIKQLVQRGQTG